jgi:DNA-binding XRE family transcriptional regulator
MNKAQRERLEKSGWKVGGVGEFLGLSPEEEAFVEVKVLLGQAVRSLRQSIGLTQIELAKRVGSSQPRIARLESRGYEDTLDLQMKVIFAARPKAMKEFKILVKKWGATRPAARPGKVTGRRSWGKGEVGAP